MQYLINSEAIIFLDSDTLNDYVTVAYDWSSDDLFLIKPHEYRVLKLIEELRIVTDEILEYRLKEFVDEDNLETILNELLNKKIIYGQE